MRLDWPWTHCGLSLGWPWTHCGLSLGWPWTHCGLVTNKQQIYIDINQNLRISQQCCWSCFWSSGTWNCVTGWAVPCVAKFHSVLTFSVKQVVFCGCWALRMKDYGPLKCRELRIQWHSIILEKTGIFDK